MTSTQGIQIPVYVHLASNEELARNMDDLATIAVQFKLPHGTVTRLARELRAGKTVNIIKSLIDYAGQLRMREPYGAADQERMAGVVYDYVNQLPEWHTPFGILGLSANNPRTRAMRLSDEQLAARIEKTRKAMTNAAEKWAEIEAESEGLVISEHSTDHERALATERIEANTKAALTWGMHYGLVLEKERRERAARDGIEY